MHEYLTAQMPDRVRNELNKIRDWKVNRLATLKDDLLQQVAAACLGRPIDITADKDKFSIVLHEGFPGREFIAYLGLMIGEVKMIFENTENGFTAGWQFLPCTKIE